MNAYTVRINVTIEEARAPDGVYLAPRSHLSYSTEFGIEGETLTDIAPQVDRIIANMKAEGVV